MAALLIVDGYNIINSWHELKKIKDYSLEGARDKLIELMQNYGAYRGMEVIIVFDAHMVKGSMEKHDKHGNIHVVFTKENETADAYIEKLMDEIGRKYNITVATSDWLEQQVVLGRGASRISSRELYIDVMGSRKKLSDKCEVRHSVTRHTIGNSLDRDVLEKLEKMRRQR